MKSYATSNTTLFRTIGVGSIIVLLVLLILLGTWAD